MESRLSHPQEPSKIRRVRRFVKLRYLLKTQGVLLGLILFISLIYILQVFLGEGWYFKYMAVPGAITDAWNSMRGGDFSSKNFAQMFSLLSAAFLHGDAGHLTGNMLPFWIFGAIAAELLGYRWMLFVFLFTGICGSVCHTALNHDQYIPSLGASGAVMGFEGLYLAMAVRWHLPDPHVWPIARPVPPSRLAMLGILALMFDFSNYVSGLEGIAYGAHIGGFIGGMFLGGFIVPMPRVALPR